MLRRFCLSIAPRFRWERLIIRTVTWIPAPTTSLVACGFPALTRSCTLHIKVYETYQTGATAEFDGRYETRYSEESPHVPYSHSLLHRFQPRLRRWHARARWHRIFFSTQFRMYEKQTLEWLMAKYCTQPRRIGLIFSITPLIGWDREPRKLSWNLPSKALRFLPFGNNGDIHCPRRLRTRRNSNPRNPNLSRCSS